MAVMNSAQSLLIAKGEIDIFLYPRMANRHGLVTGATGTGKTVTLRTLAENLSSIGVPVFLSDVKGDLSSIAKSSPSVFWDVFGEKGHPVRSTISEMGPLLLSRLLDLNDTQTGVLNLVFKIADDQGLLLLDLKDLKAMLQNVGENTKSYMAQYGNIAPATIGTIQRSILSLEQQRGNLFFGEPALNVMEFIRQDTSGRGVINILAADKLILSPKVYSTFLLWMLSELYENLPEVGDLDKPKLVFFFDEAHLLFSDLEKTVLEKIEQVVRLIRSKGVGVYFVSQTPFDVSEIVLSQLGNRVQHALRAFTPKDQKTVKAAAQTFRPNPKLKTEEVITQLQVGEALISFLDELGQPSVVQKGKVLLPTGPLGAISDIERQDFIKKSLFYGRFEQVIDRESAYEKINSRQTLNQAASSQKPSSRPVGNLDGGKILDAAVKSASRAIGSQVGRQIIRGILGSMLGKRR